MSRVFIIEPVRGDIDIAPARRFGEVVTVFPKNRPSIWTPLFGKLLHEKLETLKYDPLVDYIAMSGTMMALIVVSAAIAGKYGRFRALTYNTKTDVRDYEPMMLGKDVN